MSQLLVPLRGALFLHNSIFYDRSVEPLTLLRHGSRLYNGNYAGWNGRHGLRSFSQGTRELIEKFSVRSEENICDGGQLDTIPHVLTLREYPKEKLSGKVVLVRFDSTLLLGEPLDLKISSVNEALFTIKYLYDAGAKVLLVSNWNSPNNPMFLSAKSVADYLSSLLQLKVVPTNCISGYMQSRVQDEADILLFENLSKFREELANCFVFAEKLSSGVDIFVNDAFSQSHKILASNVGVTRFCAASVAGFQFEKDLFRLIEATMSKETPNVAIIGGGNILDKAPALHFLASICDGLVFVGLMAFQIMHALGQPVPLNLVERSTTKDSLKIIQLAQTRNIPVLVPKDFWCSSGSFPKHLDLFPAHGIPEGWSPVGLGPVSLDEIACLLSKCKKILWIGPVKFQTSEEDTHGASKLAMMLTELGKDVCSVSVVGNAACNIIMKTSRCPSLYNIIENASVVWEFLKGRKLPGVTALDRAYPFDIDWDTILYDPTQPLIVDIGSGNGLFILGMARKQKQFNYLGLEINDKLVRRCLNSVRTYGLKNVYFIATNATSTFRSIVSSYPGKLILASVQVFLQSDIEAVALRMKEQFLIYGKGKLAIVEDDMKVGQGGWLEENPFGVWSDWERHVIDRGDPMYRLMISKVD
ncbi:PREDICTED: phosphoglycerate kinase, cytosolic-like isoform X2 [Nelumbo nucifera]|uniref:Phosphoglycerate kinase n=2 Tax=Nelumbo nucifera TaxID=4432 RepID=A0A1U8Q2C6_NELNU|nr:PREDICTED: phosphoglycerate kinase, cytosolic-like isoform X2 [Nelumbo nucifera]